MAASPLSATTKLDETLAGIVDRVTYHNEENGWSVLRVQPFQNSFQPVTVTVHQTKVFAGATMEFRGAWRMHDKFGRQFVATQASERKPATTAALEKYLGSGLIKGVGPQTAKKIVRHFGEETLAVFEEASTRLLEVPGIAERKLEMIQSAWHEHRSIREVMIFLQAHGLSTLFAVRIYKQYADQAIQIVKNDPYRLASDIYGIGFFSADKIALRLGLANDSPQRVRAAIQHLLAASREEGHCYLDEAQLATKTAELLELDLGPQLIGYLSAMASDGLLKIRRLPGRAGGVATCYYSKTLYYEEQLVAEKIKAMNRPVPVEQARVETWLQNHGRREELHLSRQQTAAVATIVGQQFSILTGGPGCGKTTTTRVLVKLLQAMGLSVLLAAPTGRAAQRMSEVIGLEAKTIHRLLEWQHNKFKRDEDSPLSADFLLVDECSMLDISLAAALLRAVPSHCQLLFIGDPDQLPPVGAGNVLHDLLAAATIPCLRLTEVFRQAQASRIIQYAHQINQGLLPQIESPFKKPELWREKVDCLFIDADEATQEQLRFIERVKRHHQITAAQLEKNAAQESGLYSFRTAEAMAPYETELQIPKKFAQVDLNRLLQAPTSSEELLAVLNSVHPWSALHYGLPASEVIKKLYLEWIPKYFGSDCEIQVLSPMTRGSLGTVAINRSLQAAANPAQPGKAELTIGERTLRVGDRVIHRRNNYELGVFNGDIGVIREIDNEEISSVVAFFPDLREVLYKREDLMELELAYGITIHKSQGSEFEVVIIPILGQHFKMLFRNLIYTGLTRARKLAVLVGTRKALAMAIKNQDTSQRQTALKELLNNSIS